MSVDFPTSNLDAHVASQIPGLIRNDSPKNSMGD